MGDISTWHSQLLLDLLRSCQVVLDTGALDGQRSLHHEPRVPLPFGRVLIGVVSAPEVDDSHLKEQRTRFCATSLSIVIYDFIDLGKIFDCGFEDFAKRKMLTTLHRMMAKKSYRHIRKTETVRISKMFTTLRKLHSVKSY